MNAYINILNFLTRGLLPSIADDRLAKLLAIGTMVGLGLLTPRSAQADNFHVANGQALQNALTTAAANGADDVIYLAAGYYGGNFNFNSAEARSLTLQGEPGTTNTQITVDGTGTGISLSLSCSSDANFTIQGITFVRNGNTGLHVATGTGAAVLVLDSRFLPPANGASGLGLEIVSGQSANILRCTAAGYGRKGTGISISGITGNVALINCVLSTNLASVFTGEYGYATGGAGFYAAIAGVLTISGNSFLGDGPPATPPNQSAVTIGAGAHCSAASILLVSNVFSGCSAYDGNGAFLKASQVTVSNNNFNGNSAGYGGALSLQTASGTYNITGNTFVGNGTGGLTAGGATGTVTGNTFSGNTGSGANASADGALLVSGNSFQANQQGGAYCQAATLAVSNNRFSGNYGANGYDGGGGLTCSYFTTATVSNNTFTGNSAGGAGGGLYVWRASGGAISILNNNFTGNSAGGFGGGIACPQVDYNHAYIASMLLSGNVFKQNASRGSGGGVMVAGPTVQVTDNLFVQNSAGNSGGGIYANPQVQLDMINNTVTGNTNSANGGGAAFQIDGLTEILHVYNNIIWGNSATGKGADVYLAGTGQRKEFLFNDVDDMYGVWDLALNNPDIDPQFFDPINGDFHLRPSSGCVNTGTNGAPVIPGLDLDGGPRIVNGTVDLGCYEFNNGALHPADTNIDWTISLAEFNPYAYAWQNSLPWATGPTPITADFVTRAGYLLQSGGTYHNDGSSQPTNWKPGAQ